MFTIEERETIAIRLGYDVDEIKHELDDITSPTRKLEVDRLLLEIEGVRSAITLALSKAHVVEVGEIKLDYIKKINILKNEWSRLLGELSAVCGIPIIKAEYGSKKYYIKSWC